MSDKKSPYWNHVEVGDNKLITCKYCKKTFKGGAARIKSHIHGLPGVSKCPLRCTYYTLKIRVFLRTDTRSIRPQSRTRDQARIVSVFNVLYVIRVFLTYETRIGNSI